MPTVNHCRVLTASLGVALTCGALTLGSCGGPPPASTLPPPTDSVQGVRRYYPVESGFHWSFAVQGALGGPSMLVVTRVVAFDGKIALLRTGESTTVLQLAPDGIVREASHAYLLKWPIRLGERWGGAKGATVEVTKVGVNITVDAGSFSDCVETTEQLGGSGSERTQTTFCPGVGPVALEASSTGSQLGEPPQRFVARLRSFGPVGASPSRR